MLATMQELLAEAELNQNAVGAFTAPNLEIAAGIVRAAQESNTPVILMIAEGRMAHSPLHLIGPMLVEAARCANVKICVHLDHGLTLDMVKRALSYGFTSVMFDGSRYDLEENIRLTNEAARLARACGASVEAELGTIGGREATDQDESIICTDVEQIREFSQRVDVDAIAPAIGTAHGHYKGKPHLYFDRLQQIHEAVAQPLVLHGGSGISDEDFWKCIRLGMRKINITTANLDAMVQASQRYLLEDGEHTFYGLNERITEAVCASTLHCIDVFRHPDPEKHLS